MDDSVKRRKMVKTVIDLYDYTEKVEARGTIAGKEESSRKRKRQQ
jgi:hypothetical protein